MPIRFWIAAAVVLLGIGLLPFYAHAQEIYRPILVKQSGEDTGLFCLTSEEIALGAKLMGIAWLAEPNSMTLMSGKDEVEIEFTGACATSAKLVRQ